MPVFRKRLLDFQLSMGPELIGYCSGDQARIAGVANRIQERLLTCREAGDTGWYGSYAEMVFNVSQTSPYLTTPRGVARLIRVDRCDLPIQVNNQFGEYLAFGSGRWPRLSCSNTTTVCNSGPQQAFRRNTVCTAADLTVPGYGILIYPADPADVGKRVLVGCNDANGNIVRTLDGTIQVDGVFVSLAAPFAPLVLPGTTPILELSAITNIQKDITLGAVSIFQVNLTTGAQSLLVRLEPGEEVAAYGRYYFAGLPTGCCPTPGVPGAVQVTAMVKLDLIPVQVSTDYLLIQSIEAMIAEGESMRLGSIDGSGPKQEAAERHREAVRYLQGQLVHYEGKDTPAVNFAPFGSARLHKQRIGSMM